MSKLEMSLDDIIQQNKVLLGVSSSDSIGSSKKRSPYTIPKKNQTTTVVVTNGVIRPRKRFGNNNAQQQQQKNAMNSNANSSTRLFITNLDYGVTDADIVELFSEFGKLRKAGVHYDKNGKSQGSAELVYERRADALKAMQLYNGVPLDGREMNIQLTTSEIPENNTNAKSRGMSDRLSGVVYKRGTTRGGNKKSQSSNQVFTAEELDAELDEYNSHRPIDERPL